MVLSFLDRFQKLRFEVCVTEPGVLVRHSIIIVVCWVHDCLFLAQTKLKLTKLIKTFKGKVYLTQKNLTKCFRFSKCKYQPI